MTVIYLTEPNNQAVPFQRHLESLLHVAQTIPASTWVTAGAAAFVAFAAGLAFSRGVLQQLLSMVSLIIAIWVGWYVFTNRTDVFGSAGSQVQTDRLLLFSAGAALLAYVLCKVAVKMLAAMGLIRLVGGMAGWKGLIISAVPSTFLLWIASMGLRFVGDVHGMESAAAVARQGSKVQAQVASVWDRLGKQMDRSTFGSLAAKMDPFDMRATANLARLLILWPDGTVWQKLAQDPKTNKVLNHERIKKLGADSKVRGCIDKKDFAGLIQLPQVEEAAGHPDLKPVLTGLALEDAMDAIIYKRPVVAKR